MGSHIVPLTAFAFRQHQESTSAWQRNSSQVQSPSFSPFFCLNTSFQKCLRMLLIRCCLPRCFLVYGQYIGRPCTRYRFVFVVFPVISFTSALLKQSDAGSSVASFKADFRTFWMIGRNVEITIRKLLMPRCRFNTSKSTVDYTIPWELFK